MGGWKKLILENVELDPIAMPMITILKSQPIKSLQISLPQSRLNSPPKTILQLCAPLLPINGSTLGEKVIKRKTI